MTHAKSAAYLWYPRDFAADEHVVLMDLTTEGAYRRLLDHQWLHGSVPSDLQSLSKICKGVSVPAMRRMWPLLAPCFQPSDDDPNRLANARLERVREDWLHIRGVRAEAGSRGGRPPANGNQLVSKPKANVKLTTPTPTSTPTAASKEAATGGYLTGCVVALNTSLEQHPALAGTFRVVAVGTQEGAVTWEADGIPLDTATRVIRDLTTRYRPTPRNRQPASLRYFDAAVRDAHDRATLPAMPAIPSTSPKRAPRITA